MNKRRGLVNRGGSRKSRHQSVPRLERVEDRVLMAVFTVTNTSDVANATANDGSLRGEILASNATTTANSISFNLPSGPQTITINSPLPAITDTLLIDGSTQPGFATTPLIQLRGLGAIAAGPGLSINAAGSEVRDLIINRFNGDGIDLNGGTGIVDGCWIGIDATGAISANRGVGVVVASPNNAVGSLGGITNVISGNNTGVLITGFNANTNRVIHSYVGTDPTGNISLGNLGPNNTGSGIEVDTTGNTIGGVSSTGPAGLGNLISGNYTGILISGSTATKNLVEGNYLNTDLTGLIDIDLNATNGQGTTGIDIRGAAGNTIGGLFTGTGNVLVSGNAITLEGSGSKNNIIEGNLIGVGPDHFTPVGNILTGVMIQGGSQNLVGGTDIFGFSAPYGNTISGWTVAGVQVVGGTGDGILSNSIYSTKVLSNPIPNSNLGILLSAANGGVKAPTITSAQTGAGQTQVSGTYAGNPNTDYRIQFFASPQPNPNGIGDGRDFLGELDLFTDSQGTATFSTILLNTAPVGYVLTATATQNVLILNNTSPFSKSIQVIQAPVSDLAVTTTLPSVGPQISQPYTFTLTVVNNGPNDATNVVLTDTLPTNSIYSSATTTQGTVTASGGVVTVNIGTVPANANPITITITVTPKTVGTFINTAIVTSDALDPTAGNNTSTTTGTVVPDADISVVLTPSATLTPVGTPVQYTLSVGNSGPSVATGTVVTVQFPADFTNFVVVPDSGSYVINPDNSITVNLGIVPASSALNVVFTATPTAVGTAIVTATAMSPLADPHPENNTTSATVVVGNAADLAVTLTSSPSPALVGQDVFFTAVVTNNGPSAASSVVLTDTLPAGLIFDPANSSAPNGSIAFSNGVVTVTLNPLLTGDSDTVVIATIPTASAQLTNTILATSAEIDPDSTNNSATVSVPISPADVSVTVNGPNDPLLIGQNAVFQVVVVNNGTTDATNVTVLDTFSSGRIVAVSGGQFLGNQYGVILPTLASGQMVTLTIVLDTTAFGPLTSASTVTADQYDPDPSNNSAGTTNLVSPADIAVSIIASPGPVILGQTATYIVTVTNNGPTPATNVRFTDALPAGSYFLGAVASQGNVAPVPGFGSVVGVLGTLAPGASATVTISMQAAVAGSFPDSAVASSDGYDPNVANNFATITVPFVNLPGTIQFTQALSVVGENAGYVALLVQRTDGNLGAVSVQYATQNAFGAAGVNYVASAGTLNFQDGQSYALIFVPVLDDFRVDGNAGFFVTLSSPSNGALLGSLTSAAVIVANTDRDMIPPAITSLLAIPNGNSLNGFVITFNKAMDLSRVSLLSNYYVFQQSNSGALTRVPLVAALYNPSNFSVTLVPPAPLPGNTFYEVIANGSVGTAITDASGNLLYGTSGPNSNYNVFYGQGTKLVYNDSQNNQVTINLTGGGNMGIYRASNGDAAVVNLYGIVPHSTRLTGSVKKLNKFGSGHTNIGQINGFGRFGDVKSTLTTPQFYVGSAPISAASVGVGVPVSAASVTTSTVSVKKTTPKGPHLARR